MQLITPYRGSLALVALALVVQTVARLASPWPLKVVLDSVLGGDAAAAVARPPGRQRSPLWRCSTRRSRPPSPSRWSRRPPATPAPTPRPASASGSPTTSVRPLYAHLQRLSLSFHERRQVGPLISTITDDVRAVQDFASQSLVSMVVDVLTIVGVLVVMFSLNWNFTLIALSVTPLLALFVYRLRHLVRTSTHDVRRRQSEIVSIVQEGLTAIRVVKAFAQGEFERQRLDAKSLESVEAGLRARRIRALLPSMVTVLVATGTAAVLWFGARLVLRGADDAPAPSSSSSRTSRGCSRPSRPSRARARRWRRRRSASSACARCSPRTSDSSGRPTRAC